MSHFKTKQEIISQILQIVEQGPHNSIKSKTNSGGCGNTLEKLLGVQENNLPIPNLTEWELKTSNINSNSLITLFHREPSPQGMVTKVFLPIFGWAHKEAGDGYPITEKSFRQTLYATRYTDRGFTVYINKNKKRIEILFDKDKVDRERHKEWLDNVERNIKNYKTKNQSDPPIAYWTIEMLEASIKSKLTNCFFVEYEKKGNTCYFKSLWILQDINQDTIINSLMKGEMAIDFDARTGHNHGTKFRVKDIKSLYKTVKKIESPEQVL